MVPLKIKSAKKWNAHKPISKQDLISNLPLNVIDKILKRLPIKMVAKMSILSWKWRQVWLCLKHLVFDKDFWDEEVDKYDDEDYRDYFDVASNCNSIISNILFHHVGSVHEFNLFIPNREVKLDCGGWLSLLSKVGVKKIVLFFQEDFMTLPSYIFNCKDLVKLKIEHFTLIRPPSYFKGFAYIQSVELRDVEFEYDVYSGLIAKCPRLRRLTMIRVEYWTDKSNRIVLDAPSLEYLTIEDEFETVVFKNVPRLRFVSLHLYENDRDIVKARVDHFIEMLANSCPLQELHCGGQMCKHFGAGCITMSPILKFLNRLHLTNVDLNDYNGFCFTISMVQCCPFLKDLDISVNWWKRDIEHEFEYNKNCELGHLIKVKITGITGSRPELKLIEFLLSSATKLEILAFKCYGLAMESELKVTRDLLELPRTSPNAKLVCLVKY